MEDVHSIGHVTQITRYPVKSMAGENINRTHFADYGLYGDRSHAFINDSKEGWERYKTAREIPDLLGYKVKFLEGGHINEFPELHITSPNGDVFNWNDRLLQEIQKFSKHKLSMINHRPSSRGLLAVDEEGVLIITDRSLAKLENILGTYIDMRRFRANLVVSLTDESILDETKLIGKQLCIGSTRLNVVQECQRCSMITIDPDNYERDSYILKKVNEEMNMNFGVYASVTEPGDAGISDIVYIAE